MNVVPVEQIRTEARKVRPAPTFLLVIASVLYALGFALGFVVNIVWLAITWSWAAVKVGWQDGQRAARAHS